MQALTNWVPDTWYDVVVIYNFNTKEYEVTVSDGKNNYSVSGVMTDAGDMLYPNRLEFFSPYTSIKLANEGMNDQITYWDNIRAFEDWRYTLPSGDRTNLGDCFDFEDLEVTGDVSKTTQTGDKGSQWSVTLNDTNQYGVTPYVVKESETDNNKMLKLVANPSRTYGQFTYQPKRSISDTLYFKGTIIYKDINITSFLFRFIGKADKTKPASVTIDNIQTGTAETGYNAEFSAPLDEQIATLQNCVDLTYEKTGITLRSLGVPHNITSDDLTAALEQFPQFKTLICSGTKECTGKTFVHLRHNTGFESGTGVLHPLETIKADYLQRTANWKYAIFQGHSPYWNEESTQIFKDLTSWLKSEKAVSMTPTEYYYFMNM